MKNLLRRPAVRRNGSPDSAYLVQRDQSSWGMDVKEHVYVKCTMAENRTWRVNEYRIEAPTRPLCDSFVHRCLLT